MPPSILNQKTPEFRGAANAIYGDRGPARSELDYRRNTGKAHDGPPQSLADHVDQCLDRIKGLGPKQKLALHNELLRLLRDVEVIRLIHAQTGPWAQAAVQDEGRPL
jgi:hypothetical protein